MINKNNFMNKYINNININDLVYINISSIYYDIMITDHDIINKQILKVSSINYDNYGKFFTLTYYKNNDKISTTIYEHNITKIEQVHLIKNALRKNDKVLVFKDISECVIIKSYTNLSEFNCILHKDIKKCKIKNLPYKEKTLLYNNQLTVIDIYDDIHILVKDIENNMYILPSCTLTNLKLLPLYKKIKLQTYCY